MMRTCCLILAAFITNCIYAADVDLGPRNWTWGDGDELGAGNRMNKSTIMAALASVKKGEVIELSHMVSEDAPQFPGFQPPYVISMYKTSDRSERWIKNHLGAVNGLGFNIERIEMTVHVSTHIDSLGHVSIEGLLYGGVPNVDGVADKGLVHGGIEKAPPFIAKAIMLDIAGYRGVDYMKPGEVVTVADLEGALARQGVEIPEAAIVMINTGWGQFFDKTPAEYTKHMPGIGISASKWLAAKNIVAVGADTMAVEVVPWEQKEVVLPVHQHLITNEGIYMIENLKLDELAANQIYAISVLILPTKYRGASGSPVRIIGLR
jgi:kynurenine formamidase